MYRSLPQYAVIKTEELADIHSKGTLLRHKKTGAHVLILENNDENKVFDICFRTPPADSTGVAHILEHSVLCGSRNFPAKDPFVELAKGSLNTFLNAMTYPDKTMYPVASCNLADFCNLMHVYMDAVLFPNIYEREEIFRQEGWGYVLDDPEGEVRYNGVVYNEMKGAFSSPDSVLSREIMNSLFPDTPYGVESGGNPAAIPDLSYEDFLSFHSRYYHPSNSYIYLYGDLDMEERLAWLDAEYLSKFDRLEIDSEIPLQAPFEKPAEVCMSYPISNADEEKGNTYLAWNVVVGTSADVKLSTAMAVLEYVLLSAPGAPLKQALLDAGIGKDVDGEYDGGILQPVFSVIAKYTDPEKKDEFLRVIRESLQKFVAEGLEKKALLGAINDMEFRAREADFASYPKGLMYAITAFDSWLYDAESPFDYLRELEILNALKELAQTRYFEDLIQTYLLDNTHVSIMQMVPEKGLTEKEDAKVRERLAAWKATLSEEEIAELVRRTNDLRAYQSEPSTKEELEKIPLLSLSDVGKKAAPLQNRFLDVDGAPLVYHDYETNGIAYLDLIFSIPVADEASLPYLGILREVLGKVDTARFGYRELNSEIQLHSGGIYPAVTIYQNAKDPKKFQAKFSLRGKMLADQVGFVFDTMEDILLHSRLDDEKRLYEIIAEEKSTLQDSLARAGHTTAVTRAMGYFSGAMRLQDMTSGIAYYKLLEEIEAHYEEKKGELVRQLKAWARAIVSQENLMASLTADADILEKVETRLRACKAKLGHTDAAPLVELAPLARKNEGFTTPGKVQYVALVGDYHKAGAYTGSLSVLQTIMSYEYLWTNLRVLGGAYGCMNGYQRTGEAFFVSFRDPHLGRTLQAYEEIAAYLRDFSISERDRTKYILGTMSRVDTPLTPSRKGTRSMNAYLINVTLEDLQKERDEILSTTQEDIRALAPYIEAVLADRGICVIGNEAKIRESEARFSQIQPLSGQGGQA